MQIGVLVARARQLFVEKLLPRYLSPIGGVRQNHSQRPNSGPHRSREIMFVRRSLAISAVALLALTAAGVSTATLTLNRSVLQTAIDGGTSSSNHYDGGFVEFEFGNYRVSKQQLNGVLTDSAKRMS
jgi:hypothetical protein